MLDRVADKEKHATVWMGQRKTPNKGIKEPLWFQHTERIKLPFVFKQTSHNTYK